MEKRLVAAAASHLAVYVRGRAVVELHKDSVTLGCYLQQRAPAPSRPVDPLGIDRCAFKLVLVGLFSLTGACSVLVSLCQIAVLDSSLSFFRCVLAFDTTQATRCSVGGLLMIACAAWSGDLSFFPLGFCIRVGVWFFFQFFASVPLFSQLSLLCAFLRCLLSRIAYYRCIRPLSPNSRNLKSY